VYGTVLSELRAGEKRSHWMWFIFPQDRGLGRSPMAQRYALASAAEAVAFLAHPVLGTSLRECTRLVIAIEHSPIGAIFGYPDLLKFQSSMRRFASVAGEEPLFPAALAQYFGDERRGPG